MQRLRGLAEQHEEAQAALLLVDLDGCEDVNDFYGHGPGDSVLVEVAGRLERAVQAQSGTAATLARLGGDEFAVVLPATSGGNGPASRALELAQRLVEQVRAPLTTLPSPVSVTASVGVACGRADDPSALLRWADIDDVPGETGAAGLDQLAARGRRRGGGAAARHLRAAERARAARAAAALPAGRARLQRAPGRAASGRGADPLEHPTRGLLPPTAFLPLAAQTGMMLELSAQVLDLALRDTARWRAQGTDLQVSVNVGADVLASPGFVPLVLDLLDVHGVPPHGLCLELTESEVLTAEGPGLLAEVRRAG